MTICILFYGFHMCLHTFLWFSPVFAYFSMVFTCFCILFYGFHMFHAYVMYFCLDLSHFHMKYAHLQLFANFSIEFNNFQMIYTHFMYISCIFMFFIWNDIISCEIHTFTSTFIVFHINLVCSMDSFYIFKTLQVDT